jgi:CRISPR/Cas system-associated exonuclease Cas4 (RecB family)
MNERWIKASEIGEYLYCQRAWWYRLQGAASANVEELAFGSRQHARHGRGLQLVIWQRVFAALLLAAALILVFVQLST